MLLPAELYEWIEEKIGPHGLMLRNSFGFVRDGQDTLVLVHETTPVMRITPTEFTVTVPPDSWFAFTNRWYNNAPYSVNVIDIAAGNNTVSAGPTVIISVNGAKLEVKSTVRVAADGSVTAVDPPVTRTPVPARSKIVLAYVRSQFKTLFAATKIVAPTSVNYNIDTSVAAVMAHLENNTMTELIGSPLTSNYGGKMQDCKKITEVFLRNAKTVLYEKYGVFEGMEFKPPAA
jgi:hypothetical protein